MASAECNWKIDDLAQRSGIGVDTIRFYSREGLLPVAERHGRFLRYGPQHLDRLRTIRELQDRHFTLAGIKDLVRNDRLDRLDRVIGSSEVKLSYSDLVEESGLAPDLVDELRDLGVVGAARLRESRDSKAFDLTDLYALRAVARLIEMGLSREVILGLAQVYVSQMSALSKELLERFGSSGVDDAGKAAPEELGCVSKLGESEAAVLESQVALLMEHLHQRTLQQLRPRRRKRRPKRDRGHTTT